MRVFLQGQCAFPTYSSIYTVVFQLFLTYTWEFSYVFQQTQWNIPTLSNMWIGIFQCVPLHKGDFQRNFLMRSCTFSTVFLLHVHTEESLFCFQWCSSTQSEQPSKGFLKSLHSWPRQVQEQMHIFNLITSFIFNLQRIKYKQLCTHKTRCNGKSFVKEGSYLSCVDWNRHRHKCPTPLGACL
jgi:hypothetical protein